MAHGSWGSSGFLPVDKKKPVQTFMTTKPKACSLTRCPKCGYACGENTWRGPVYKPGMGHGTTNLQGERVGEMLAYTCEGCGFHHEDPVLS